MRSFSLRNAVSGNETYLPECTCVVRRWSARRQQVQKASCFWLYEFLSVCESRRFAASQNKYTEYNHQIKNISRNIFRFVLLFPNVADFKENNILQRQFSSLSDRS